MDLSVLKFLEYYKILRMLEDKASSVMGKELVGELVPTNDYLEVERRIQETAEAAQILDEDTAGVPLGGIRDIRNTIKRAEINAILDPEELLAVASTLYASRRIKMFFNKILTPVPLLTNLVNEITILQNIENLIESAINEHGIVKDDASSELQRIRREIKASHVRIKEKLDSILRSSEYQKFFQENLVTVRGDRYVIPVKQEHRNNFPGIIHDQSASGATVFIEPIAIVNLNNDIKQLMSAEKKEIERILRSLSDKVGQSAAPILNNCLILAQVDFIFAKAKLSIDMQATRPLINCKGIVDLRQARHPLIDKEIVVPIDIKLGNDFNILLITGPNTGGKTVSLKTIGLFALMSQAGLFIPCAAESQIAVFSNVFADIGDEQSIEQSLSTFSAHMTNVVNILSKTSNNDLVLIDELGAGTDPQEGAALAMSILEYLLKANSRAIVTTHYSELKTFAFSRHGIENASVEFDIQSLKPTYRLLIGTPGSSNAFAISSRLGLRDDIVNRAKELIDHGHAEFESILNSLEEKKNTYARLNQDVVSQRKSLDALNQKLEYEKNILESKRSDILAKAREEAASLLRNARREATEVINELKAQFSVKETKERQHAIDKARHRLRESIANTTINSDFVSQEPIRRHLLTPGASVYISSLNQNGIIISVGDMEANVQVGIMKVNVPLSTLRVMEKVNAGKTRRSQSLSKRESTVVSAVSRQVDIRGTTVEEAEIIIEKFLDDAIMAGLTEVIVIHGKGTGALRKGVRMFLKSHSLVKDISIAELNEGGDGATVVRLR